MNVLPESPQDTIIGGHTLADNVICRFTNKQGYAKLVAEMTNGETHTRSVVTRGSETPPLPHVSCVDQGLAVIR